MSLAAGTPCWLSNAHPGLKVGTAVLLVHAVTRVSYAERATVRVEAGREFIVSSLSLAAMLAEEIPAWMISDRHPE